jgi:phosphatidylcholine synthase
MRPPPASRNGAAIDRDVSPTRVALAWGVHLFTALGAVVGAVALVAIGRGDLGSAAVLMLIALVIDSADGTLARAVGVEQALPWIDGRRMDDMVDFLNYVIVPAVFMVAAGVLPHWACAATPILASCYGFSHVAAKTEDDFFLGFPSYWNIVAIYAWGLGVSAVTGAWVVAFLALMVFVPLKYAYPSKLPPVLRTLTVVLGVLWCLVLAVWVLAPERAGSYHLLEVSLAFPIYYFALSFWLDARSRFGAR